MDVNAQTLARWAAPSVATPRRSARALALAAALVVLAALAGVAAAQEPLVAVGVPVMAALVAFAFVAPVTHLMVLLVLTAVVGYTVQNGYTSLLLPSDAIVLTALLRALVAVVDRRLDARRIAAASLVLLFMAATIYQVRQGLEAGRNTSQVGAEGRELLSFGTLLLVLPILAERDGALRLARGLTVVGLLLGLWGLGTWALGISLGENVDIGLRGRSEFATSGHGQLHGGLYGYPVAVVMSAAMLLAGEAGRGLRRWSLWAVLVLNACCVALTYERTFWVTTMAAIAFVILRLGRGRRLRATLTVLVATVVTLCALVTLAPRDLSAMSERFLSLGQTSTDNSVRYRLVEARHVVKKVESRPLLGWGTGDTIYWGRAWQQVPPRAAWFAHNGYLWVIWKVGALAAALLFALLGWAVVARGSPRLEPGIKAFRLGAQGALLALLLASVTFPSFNGYSITATMGVLVGICFISGGTLRRA